MGRRTLIERIASIQAAALSQTSEPSVDNYVSMHAAPHSQTPGNSASPAFACVAAVALRARSSGIFQVHVNAAWSDSVTADTVSHELVAFPFAAAVGSWPAIANGSTANANIYLSTGGPDVASPSWNVANNAMVLAGTDAGGVAASGLVVTPPGGSATPINDSAPGSVVLFSSSDATLTGLLTANGAGTQKFSYNGISSKSGNAFPLGNIVVFGLCVKAIHQSTTQGVITYADLAMSVRELPLP